MSSVPWEAPYHFHSRWRIEIHDLLCQNSISHSPQALAWGPGLWVTVSTVYYFAPQLIQGFKKFRITNDYGKILGSYDDLLSMFSPQNNQSNSRHDHHSSNKH